MCCLAGFINISCAIELGYYHSRSRGYSSKEAYYQINQYGGSSPNGSQGLFSQKLTYNNRIGRVIEKLEKCAKCYWEEKIENSECC